MTPRRAALLLLLAVVAVGCAAGGGDGSTAAATTAGGKSASVAIPVDGGEPDPAAGNALLAFVRAARRGDARALWNLLSEPTRASIGPADSRKAWPVRSAWKSQGAANRARPATRRGWRAASATVSVPPMQ